MWRLIAVNALILVLLLVAAEGALAWLASRSTPTGIEMLNKVARKLYWANVSYVQYEPDCAQYDTELGYILRPGTCAFDSAVFSTEISVNSAGLRDDEASLNGPRIVVLGDSQAMGWGVNTGQTFADVLEQATGARTLNAGVSSYGTARELLMLERLDLQNLETVVLQYSDNDAWENRTFLANGYLEVMSRQDYDALVSGNASVGHGFGRYLPAFAREIRDRTAGSAMAAGADHQPMADLEDHEVLLRILLSRDWSAIASRLVLLEVHTGGRSSGFMQALEALPELAELQSAGLDVIVLNTSEILAPDDYLFPDGHLTVEGQRKMGEAVAQALRD